MTALVLACCVGSSLLTAALAVPLMRRWVAPNPLYGFRTPRTLAEPRVWYDANAQAGRYLFRASVLSGLAVSLLALVPGLDPDAFAWGALAIVMTGLAAAGVLSFHALGRIGTRTP